MSRWRSQGQKDILEEGVLESVSLSMKGGVLVARVIKNRLSLRVQGWRLSLRKGVRTCCRVDSSLCYYPCNSIFFTERSCC